MGDMRIGMKNVDEGFLVYLIKEKLEKKLTFLEIAKFKLVENCLLVYNLHCSILSDTQIL